MAKSKSIVKHQDKNCIFGQRTRDGYINLNDISKSSGKRLDNWIRLKETTSLLREFELDEIYEGTKPLIKVQGKNGGTWAHPDIAIQFAQWCSPAFALLVSRVVREWMMNGAGNPLWHQNRKQLKESNQKLRDAIARYVDRHPELSDNKKKYVYSNVNDKLAIAIVGCRPAKFRRDNHTNTFREALNREQLKDLELLESVVIRLIDKDVYPLEAVENAKERLMIGAA